MKFTDGYWKVREDLSLYQAAEAVETETTEHSITVYLSLIHIYVGMFASGNGVEGTNFACFDSFMYRPES